MSGQPFAARRVHDRDDDDRAAFSGLRRGRQPRVARARRSSVLTAAVIVVGLWAPAAGDSHPEVLPARSTARGEICFDVPATMVDWRSTAAATLGDDTVAAPTARTLRDNYHEPGGVSAIEYSAVSPPRVMQRRWLLLHEGGSFVVTPSTLRGRIFYPVSGTFDVNGDPFFTGAACARHDEGDIRAAFVVADPSASWSSNEVVVREATPGQSYRLSIDSGDCLLLQPQNVFTAVREVRAFAVEGRRPSLCHGSATSRRVGTSTTCSRRRQRAGCS
jgi:hypothetical protein